MDLISFRLNAVFQFIKELNTITSPKISPKKNMFSHYSGKNLIAFFLLFLGGIQFTKAQQTPVKYSNYVNDFAGVLSSHELDYLNRLFKELEDSVGAQIAVAIEKTAGGYDAFDRAMFIVRNWEVGNKGVNNGILIYIATQDKKYFIVTADQTQGVLPDAVCGEIGRNILKPHLKKKEYFAGIRETAYELAAALGDEFKGRVHKSKKDRMPKLIFPILFFLLFYLLFIRRGGGGGFNRRGFYTPPIFWGGGFGSGWNSGSGFGGSSGGFGGFGGGGGFNGGGAGGSWD